MDALIQTVRNYLASYDWDNPLTFVFVIAAGLLFFRKFSIFIVLVATVIAGTIVRNMIVLNINTNHEIVALDWIVYGIGGLLFVVYLLISFYRS